MRHVYCMQTNAATIGSERLGEFKHLSSLLQPLYAPRAAEVALFGADSASLATAAPLADCFQVPEAAWGLPPA